MSSRAVIILNAYLLCIPEASSSHIYLCNLCARQVTSPSWTAQIILRGGSDIWDMSPIYNSKVRNKTTVKSVQKVSMVSIVSLQPLLHWKADRWVLTMFGLKVFKHQCYPQMITASSDKGNAYAPHCLSWCSWSLLYTSVIFHASHTPQLPPRTSSVPRVVLG